MNCEILRHEKKDCRNSPFLTLSLIHLIFTALFIYKHGNCLEFSCLYMSFRDNMGFCVIVYRKIEKWQREEKACFSSPFSHVLGFHNSFLYISNFTDIFIAVQKIISWKAGESEVICLHGGLRFPYIGRMAKNFRADLGV